MIKLRNHCLALKDNMPMCVVPGCKSGYRSVKGSAEASASTQPSTSAQAPVTNASKISFHRFPKDENVKNLWKQKIPRQN